MALLHRAAIIIPSVRLHATEVRALYGRLSCVRVVCAWRPWLQWEVGGVVARHAGGRNGRWRPMGLSQRPVRVDCGLSYTTVQATIARSAIVDCFFIKTALKLRSE